MGTEVQPESPGSVTPILYVEGRVAPAIFWVTGAKRFTSLCSITLSMGTRMHSVSSAMRLRDRDRYYTAPKAACEAREQSCLRAGEPRSSRNALDNALALCGMQPILALAAGSG